MLIEYSIKNHVICKELYDLRELYKNFQNQAYIVCLHGSNDSMVPINDKRNFASSINKMIFMEIGDEDLDGVIFKSSNHGLDGDFLKMFQFVYENFKSRLQIGNALDLPEKVELLFEDGKGVVVHYDQDTYEVNLDVVR